MTSKARREVDWLRSNAKARTTKSQSRIDQAHELLEDLSDIRKRNQQKRASIDFAGSERETRKLLVAKTSAKKSEASSLGLACMYLLTNSVYMHKLPSLGARDASIASFSSLHLALGLLVIITFAITFVLQSRKSTHQLPEVPGEGWD